MESIKTKVKKNVAKNGNNHILIHSDVLFGFKVSFESQQQHLNNHYKELEDTCQSLDIIMPTFNYDFCKGNNYNIKEDKSQVGVLSDFFRTNIASWRSSTPVFNFSGTGKQPEQDLDKIIDPFDENSLFAFLKNNKALLMHYGSGLHSTTLIHYVERLSTKLIYRYDKKFRGLIINSKDTEVILNYHVRPMGYTLNYDWVKLEKDLINEKILSIIKEGRTKILLARIDEIVSFWLEKLTDDPFYFLDSETKSWVLPKYQELNRRFIISDFE